MWRYEQKKCHSWPFSIVKTSKRHYLCKIFKFTPPSSTMLKIFLSSIPFMVCLCWFVAFALQYRKNDSPKRTLTWFLATCVVLYLCHALYLNAGLSVGMESLWALCSLSVYPLYYIYLRELTVKPFDGKTVALCLLPGAFVALAKFLLPGEESDMARKVLFAIQVVMVCYLGYRDLVALLTRSSSFLG